MTITEIVDKIHYVTDAEGNRTAVMLDWPIWEELLALLTAEAEDAAENELLVSSGLLPRLVEIAQKEAPVDDWEQALREL